MTVGANWKKKNIQLEEVVVCPLPDIAHFTRKMEAARFSETLLSHRNTTRRYKPKGLASLESPPPWKYRISQTQFSPEILRVQLVI
jgi:hypothetical protein